MHKSYRNIHFQCEKRKEVIKQKFIYKMKFKNMYYRVCLLKLKYDQCCREIKLV